MILFSIHIVLLASPENSCFLCDTSSIFRHTTTVNSFQLLFPFFNIFFSGIEHNQCCNIQHSANANILENDLLFHQPCCFFFFPRGIYGFFVVQAGQSGDDLHLGSEGLACSLHMEAEESKVRENLGGRGLAIVYEFKNWIEFNFSGAR